MRIRLDGLLQGNHLGLVPGPGTELGEARAYQPGDDVRRIDWAVTARTTEPHVRQTVADRELETWVLVDLSPSLDFGTAACEKRDLAIAALAAVAHLTARRRQPDRRAGRATGSSRCASRPAAAWPYARGLLRKVAQVPSAPERHPRRPHGGDRSAAPPAPAPRPGRGGVRLPRRAHLGAPPARAVAGATSCSPSRCSTRASWSCPRSARSCWPTRSPVASARWSPRRCCAGEFAAAAAAHRERVALALRRGGAAHLQLRTDRDWIADVVRFALTRKRAWSGGGR